MPGNSAGSNTGIIEDRGDPLKRVAPRTPLLNFLLLGCFMADSDFYLERLTHRLAECPPEFLAEPHLGGSAGINVEAVVSDLVVDLGGKCPAAGDTSVFRLTDKKYRNFLRLVLVGAWLCHDELFRKASCYADPVLNWLKKGLLELAELVAADLFVTDPDRREELARLCLRALGLRPMGETEDQAADRLKTLGSVERSRVIAATRAKQEQARKLREAMKQKAAREAAAKPFHE